MTKNKDNHKFIAEVRIKLREDGSLLVEEWGDAPRIWHGFTLAGGLLSKLLDRG